MREMIGKFSITVWTVIALMIISVLLVFDGGRMRYDYTEAEIKALPASVIAEKKDRDDIPRSCLLINDSRQEYNDIASTHIADVLDIMKVPYKAIDLAHDKVPAFKGFRTVVFSIQDLDQLGESAIELSEYVADGGRVMFGQMPLSSTVFSYLQSFLGISEGVGKYTNIHGLIIKEGFMLGAEGGFEFEWGEEMPVAVSVGVDQSKADIWVESNDVQKVPLVWSADYGKGRWVVMNHGLFQKTSRGLTCACYSLLEDCTVWPVINASAFFLDDFPSPVPMGDGIYIRRDYKRDISSFYSDIWLPDIIGMMQDYGIRFSGFIIEDYSEDTDGNFPRQTDTERFETFGGFLLKNGGEIGLHGYNHQPFCMTGFDFKNKVDYNTWKTEADVVNSLGEVLSFTEELFPGNTVRAYVPPSNILSDEGRDILVRNMPDLYAICSVYAEGDIEYVQEFEVSDDGVVEFPRIISGGILDIYDRWAAFNCLNLYFVSSHFMHPDDCLDEDRGADMGWAQLYANICNYIEWLQSSAPGIRQLPASAAASAAARFDTVGIDREETDDQIRLRLTGFWDECWIMIRCSGDFSPGEVTGGEIQQVKGDYYLLHADSDIITIKKPTE